MAAPQYRIEIQKTIKFDREETDVYVQKLVEYSNWWGKKWQEWEYERNESNNKLYFISEYAAKVYIDNEIAKSKTRYEYIDYPPKS